MIDYYIMYINNYRLIYAMGGYFKTVLLLGGLTGLLLFCGSLFGGQVGMFIALFFAVAMNLAGWFFSDKIALRAYKAKPADKKEHKELFSMVKELSQKANIPVPSVYIIPSMHANAFATGRDPKHASVAVTRGIMQILSRSELKGVIAHELAHIKHRDILIASVAAMVGGAIASLANMVQWAAIFGGLGGNDDGPNVFSSLIFAMVAPLVALVIQMAISRSREYAADAKAANLMGGGHSLASALEKLEANSMKNPLRFGNEAGASLFITNPFKGRKIVDFFSTHPPTRERIKRLRSM